MRTLHTALSAVVAATSAGSVDRAAAQATQFRGNACIISATAACASNGYSVGNCGTARFRPPNWNGNPNHTGFSVFWGYFYGNNINAEGSLVGATFKPVQGGGVGNGAFLFEPGVTARIAGQVPATLAPGTAFLSQTVFINKFDGQAGCNVAIRFQGQRHPLP